MATADFGVSRDGRFTNLLVERTLTAKDVVVNSLSVKTGSATSVPLVQKGSATLVGGTVTVTGVSLDITTAPLDLVSHVSVTLGAVAGTTGTNYQVVPVDATSFTIQAVDTAGALVATDLSTLYWAVLY